MSLNIKDIVLILFLIEYILYIEYAFYLCFYFLESGFYNAEGPCSQMYTQGNKGDFKECHCPNIADSHCTSNLSNKPSKATF